MIYLWRTLRGTRQQRCEDATMVKPAPGSARVHAEVQTSQLVQRVSNSELSLGLVKRYTSTCQAIPEARKEPCNIVNNCLRSAAGYHHDDAYGKSQQVELAANSVLL